MSRVLVDTNVLVSFLTDRSQAQQSRSSALIERAAAGEVEVLLHQHVVTELVFVLTNFYGVGRSEVAAILEDLLRLPGATMLAEIPWRRVLDLWPATIRDFGDAVLAGCALDVRPQSVATFDQSFRRRLGELRLSSYW